MLYWGMSTKGTKLSPLTRQKISLAKTKITKDHLIKSGMEYINGILNAPKKDKKLPTIVGFCLVAGISRSRLYDLAELTPEVADIIEYIDMMQEEIALQGGITNRLNPIFSMFLLKSKQGYKDSPQVLNQTNQFNITPELLQDALKLMHSKEKKEIKGKVVK
ncbi:hypothetical protein LCGC14_2797640 [marine sediment metagenome]|uniref:Uncharacterized protein n=1 Tax=marine sediment metagenome TaxID=412755 RepID=A0A0F9BF09_9ZZZZ